MLWKAFISYLGRSSMHQDNKPYLILLCSLMSQLKGLVLPLAMGLAERIVCRLVNTGLWRSWSTFKMLVLSRRCSCMCSWLPPVFPVSNGMTTTQWLVSIITYSEIGSNSYHIRQLSRASQSKNLHDSFPRLTMLLNVLGVTFYNSVADYHRSVISDTFWNIYLSLSTQGNIQAAKFHVLCPARVARFMIIPLWHKRPGKAPLTSAIWLSHTTLGYTVVHSAIDWGVEGQLFNTSEQQVLLSSWPFSCLVSVPPKNVSYLSPTACWFKPDSICPHSPCNTPLCFWCNHDRQAGCS